MITAIDLRGWQKVFEQVMRDTYEGKLKPGELNETHIRETYNELNKAAGAGYGKDWNQVHGKESHEPDPAVLKMQQNLYKFSGAKNYAMLVELNSKMYKNGRLLSWEDFKAEALKLNDRYNVNHLQAEYQTARQSGHHAQNWQEYERNRKNFPNLKYKTQGDDRVRPEHDKLDGVVAPIDSPFWDKYYPPNGWRCRCYVVQTAAPATRDIPDNIDEDVRPEFRINVGKSGQTFSEGDKGNTPHPFFALAKQTGGRQLQQAFEHSKLSSPYNTEYKAKNGAKVEVNPFADLQDLRGNYSTAVTITEQLGQDVRIRPHIDTNLLQGYTNPEYEIGGRLADRKAIKGLNNLRKMIDGAKKQLLDTKTNNDRSEYTIVFDLSSIDKLDMTQLKTELSRKISANRGTKIYSIIFTRGDKAAELLRSEITARDFSKLDKIQ